MEKYQIDSKMIAICKSEDKTIQVGINDKIRLHLKNGNIVEGEILDLDNEYLEISIDDSCDSIDVDFDLINYFEKI